MYPRADKEDDLDTIRYEINMLDYSYVRYIELERKPGIERGDVNAFLECFLLHYRNLIEFFSSKKPREDGTDLRIGKPLIGMATRVPLEMTKKLTRDELCKEHWKNLSVFLDHCTIYRARDPKTWNVGAMYQQLNSTLADFEKITKMERERPGGVREDPFPLTSGGTGGHTMTIK